jgi:hypothetical protein
LPSPHELSLRHSYSLWPLLPPPAPLPLPTPLPPALPGDRGRLVECKGLAINPLNPALLAVACGDPYVRVYDRRMLATGVGVLRGWLVLAAFMRLCASSAELPTTTTPSRTHAGPPTPSRAPPALLQLSAPHLPIGVAKYSLGGRCHATHCR